MRILSKQLLGIAAVLAVFVAGTPATPTVSSEDLTIIANSNVKATAISQSEARDVFLGESTSVGGSRVTPVVLQKGPAQEAFLQLVGKTESGLQASWRMKVFTGKGVMPHACDSEDALVAYVSATPGAIGYISAGKTPAGVKVLSFK